ncbi:hypothetical protein AOY87_16545 [Escherichia coli]|nr:hypothetical protein AOY87_16545 [Escherichia coli]
MLPERSNFGFSFFSCIGTYHHYKLKPNGTYHVKDTQPLNTAKPRSGGTLAGLLTTNDSESIEVAMLNHTTHPQGRDSHNLNKFTWRFMQCLTDSIAIFTVTAATEREARALIPADRLIFVSRIRQEVNHVQ